MALRACLWLGFANKANLPGVDNDSKFPGIYLLGGDQQVAFFCNAFGRSETGRGFELENVTQRDRLAIFCHNNLDLIGAAGPQLTECGDPLKGI